MRVALHAGQLLQPVTGGIGRYIRSIASALPGAGVTVEPFGAGPVPDGLPPEASARWHDVGRPRGSVRYELWHRLRWPSPDVPGDLVHATSLAVPPHPGRPLVVTVHDLVFLRQPENLTRHGVAFHRRGLELTRREAGAVVVPSAFGRDDLAREGFDPERVVVAHHGVRAPAPAADPEAALRELGVTSPYLLFVSTIEPRKGVEDVVAAHRQLRARHPDLELGLVLAGAPGWGRPPDLGGPGVVSLGWVSDESTLDVLYRHAVALAHPARYEGFGLTPLEAMARGCPVVVSDAACLPEVVGAGGIVVPTGDVGALTEALDELVRGGDAWARWSRAGSERARAFTWEASAAAHRRAYDLAIELASETSA